MHILDKLINVIVKKQNIVYLLHVIIHKHQLYLFKTTQQIILNLVCSNKKTSRINTDPKFLIMRFCPDEFSIMSVF